MCTILVKMYKNQLQHQANVFTDFVFRTVECDNVCLNGGTCVATNTCECTSEFSGDLCNDRKYNAKCAGYKPTWPALPQARSQGVRALRRNPPPPNLPKGPLFATKWAKNGVLCTGRG